MNTHLFHRQRTTNPKDGFTNSTQMKTNSVKLTRCSRQTGESAKGHGHRSAAGNECICGGHFTEVPEYPLKQRFDWLPVVLFFGALVALTTVVWLIARTVD